MRRGELWLAPVGGTLRPVLVLTRTDVLPYRGLVTVAEVTTKIRGTAVEVAIDWNSYGLDRESVVNADGIHTIAQPKLSNRIAVLTDADMLNVCEAVSFALGC